MATLSREQKDLALLAVADALEANAERIIEENKRDLNAGRDAGLSDAMLDRLTLSSERITSMAQGVREVAELPDAIGTELDSKTRENGLLIRRVRVPIGVIALIFESRPNVTVDASVLCLKSGNACILRGGKEAIYSNRVLGAVLGDALESAGVPRTAVQVVDTTDRAFVGELLKCDREIDVVIPRGGEGLIRRVVAEATMPVLKHYTGNCHVFVDESADVLMAVDIVENAKCHRPGVCNALETLLIHKDIASVACPQIAERLAERGVELYADETAMTLMPNAKLATEDDWHAEYLSLTLAVKVVNSLDDAIEHINAYGSHHTDAIVSKDASAIDRFKLEIDSGCVHVNCSTRFSDGFEYGLGAEIGISTDKLHARGPMGLVELTTYKWIVDGTGQIRE